MSGQTDRSPGFDGEARRNSIGCPPHPRPGPPPSKSLNHSLGWPLRGGCDLKGSTLGKGGRAGLGGPLPHPPTSQQNNSHPPPPPRGLSGAFVLAGRAGGARRPPPPGSRAPRAGVALPSRSRKNKEAEGAPFPPGFAPLREPQAPQYLPRREGAGAGPLLGGPPRAGAARRAGCGRIRGAARPPASPPAAALRSPWPGSGSGSRRRRRRLLRALQPAAPAAGSRSRLARARRLPLSPGPPADVIPGPPPPRRI